ncbi:hypothetical protein BE04_45725 [Sorangium cellulosum]|uniref:Uncharacterized protein n=2 Tax=Sorangium cellulosum TaxID=56 RepID=A0A150PJN5_SORCE|nr:hypothetical protein [Sorangium cellulosum]AGP34986.1 hypothetical protein SCE1572_10970 [Sorangium cellulosum So0157-2]KYF55668.1 hypothetical protein BE04_45725 [Sorangium cellulosum]
MDLPDESQIRWILRTSSTLLQHGAEPVRGLVQPTAEFFPDPYDGTPKTVAALMLRVQEHAGLQDLPVELAVVTPEGQASTVSCSSGACGGMALDTKLERVARRDDGGYRVALSAGELRNPTVLTTAFVRAVSFMFLSEAGAFEALVPPDRDPAVDLAAVLLGFGVLVTNGSYLYAKGCGGVQVHSATKMPVDELALALAVYCRLHEVPDRAAARHLDVTPRAHFDESAVWASSNVALVRMLRAAPDRIAADDYAIGESRSWLARALGLGKRRPARTAEDELRELERELAPAAGAAKPRSLDEGKAKKLAEIRALVDESLGS